MTDFTATPDAPWWHYCAAIRRYMPYADGVSAGDIIRQLDDVKASGYQAIQITAPYHSAGYYPWWGLRPADYFTINRTLGSRMAEFERLVEACHQKELRILIFLNPGYADVESPLWQEACRQKRLGLAGEEQSYFLWRGPSDPPQPVGDGSHFIQDHSRWETSPAAQASYWCHWKDGELAEPQYDWSQPSFRAFIRRVLTHWLETGVDGIILDAVNWYLNCNWQILRDCVVSLIHSYPGTLCIPEGATGFHDDFLPWLQDGQFDVIEDQTFHSDWNGSAILDAINTQDTSLLEARLAVRDAACRLGKPAWSYLCWGDDWTPPKRLLEVAVLLGTGHMTEIIDAEHLDALSPGDRQQLHAILRCAHHPGLAPIGSRRQIPSGDKRCYACIRSEETAPVLCVYNFSPAVVQICIPLDVPRQPLCYWLR